jgi:CrcB protein
MAGAAIGGLARYIIGGALVNRYGSAFPWGTLFVNITGSFLIGVLMTLFTGRLDPHHSLRLFLVVGLLGGYTTFSSFEWELLETVRFENHLLAALYIAASVGLGYLAVVAGAAIARRG